MKKLIRNSTAEFLIFTAQAGKGSIEVRVEDEMVWLTQKLIAELLAKGRSTITKHLKNIFSEGELEEETVAVAGDLWQLARHHLICGDCRNS